jgi:hypothetical protein
MAAGNTYDAIATQTLGSAAATVTFSSIPSTYTDLVLIIDAVGSDGSYLRFNSDSGSNYSYTRIYGDGSSAVGGRATSQTVQETSIGSLTNRQFTTVNVMNYSNTTTNKTSVTRITNPSSFVAAYVNLWRSTSAITSITFGIQSGTYSAGSTFSLYGIASA